MHVLTDISLFLPCHLQSLIFQLFDHHVAQLRIVPCAECIHSTKHTTLSINVIIQHAIVV